MKIHVVDRSVATEPVSVSDEGDNLPEGWSWTTVGEVSAIRGGIQKQPKRAPRQAAFPYLRVANVLRGRLDLSDVQRFELFDGELETYRLLPGDVLVVEGNGSISEIGRSAIWQGQIEDCVHQNHIIRVRPQHCLASYLNAYINSPAGTESMAKVAVTTAGLYSLSTGKLAAIPMPLPPAAEQRRILEAVEALLARVEAGRARLERVPAILKRFRQAVLAAACSGRLTEDWRRQNPATESAQTSVERCANEIADETATRRRRRRRGSASIEAEMPTEDLPSTWTVRTLGHLIEHRAVIEIQDGNHGELYPRKSEFGPEGAVFLTAKQVLDGRILLDEAPRLSMQKARRLRIGFARAGDVLLTHNATVGRAAVLREAPDPCLLGTSVTYHRLNQRFIDPDYYCLFLRGPFWQDQLSMMMEQTTRNQVPITKQVELSVVIPPVDEQREIARQVERLFALADAVDRRVAVARKQADGLPQAILARAFSGKLVPTEAELARQEGREFEPASALLERIRRERAAQPVARRSRRRSPN